MTDPHYRAAQPAGGIRWYMVVLTLGLLAMLVIGSWSWWLIGGGWWLGALAMVLFIACYVAGWALWLAPGSRFRFRFRERLATYLVVGTGVAILAALAGIWLPALVALSVAVLGDSLNERGTELDLPPANT